MAHHHKQDTLQLMEEEVEEAPQVLKRLADLAVLVEVEQVDLVVVEVVTPHQSLPQNHQYRDMLVTVLQVVETRDTPYQVVVEELERLVDLAVVLDNNIQSLQGHCSRLCPQLGYLLLLHRVIMVVEVVQAILTTALNLAVMVVLAVVVAIHQQMVEMLY